MDAREKRNIDVLGQQWILAPGGRETIQRCQTRMFDLQAEIASVGALLKNMGNSEISPDEWYGIGLILERISKRLCKNSDRIAKTMIEVIEEKK